MTQPAYTELEIEAALARAERQEAIRHRETLDKLRQWIIPDVVSENNDMIASRILASELRRIRSELTELKDNFRHSGYEADLYD